MRRVELCRVLTWRTFLNRKLFFSITLLSLTLGLLPLKIPTSLLVFTRPKLTNSITMATFFTSTCYPRCPKEPKVSKVFCPTPTTHALKPPTPTKPTTSPHYKLSQKGPTHPHIKPKKDPTTPLPNPSTH
jgi:hypothetical protein